VILHADVAAARLGANVAVEAHLQVPVVHELGQGLDATGETVGVGHLLVRHGIALQGGPAVVDVHLGVTMGRVGGETGAPSVGRVER
jgi:hypothetical protein